MCELIIGNSSTRSNNSSTSTSDKTCNDAKVIGGASAASTLTTIITIVGVILEVARRKDRLPYFKRHLSI